MPWPMIVAGVASAAGSYLANRQQRYAGNSEALWNNALLARQEYQNQKEFAQHGLRWKVEDAKQAGINPLVALGASTHSPSASIGSSSGSYRS